MRMTLASRVVIGAGLFAVGCTLMFVALSREHERTETTARRQAREQFERTQAAAISPPGASGRLTPAADVRTGLDGGAPFGAGAYRSDAASPGAPPDGGSAPEAGSADAGGLQSQTLLFRFYPGGTSISEPELNRLLLAAKLIAKQRDSQILVEGFPDRPGIDRGMAMIASHRAKVGQILLMKAGVAENWITLATPKLDEEGKLVRTMRITVVPPVPELETP